MQSVLKYIDSVTVIELRPAQLNPHTIIRVVDEPEHLRRLLNAVDLENPPPILLDLTRLEHLTSWENADITMVLGWVKHSLHLPKLVALSDHTDFLETLQRDYHGDLMLFSQQKDALKAASDQNREVRRVRRAAG